MNDIIGGLMIFMAVLYFVCVEGSQAFRQSYINFGKRNLKDISSDQNVAANSVLLSRAASYS